MTSLSTLAPADFGLPSKFSIWRPGQWESIEQAISSPHRFIASSIPTGGGKSVFGVTCSILQGTRAVYLTSTKPLQQQLASDFAPCGMKDIRGRQNYHCVRGASMTCADGRLADCRDMRCSYKAERERFLKSQLGSSNYAYYLSSTIHSEGVGDVGMLVLDEAHSAINELCSAIEIKITHHTCMEIYQLCSADVPDSKKGITELKSWASTLLPRVKRLIDAAKGGGSKRLLTKIDGLALNLERLAKADETWIVDEYIPGELLVSPLWPTKYAQEYLFRNIPKVLLMSATLVPKTLDLLDIPRDQCTSINLANTFDPSRSPVYMFGACKVDYRMTPAEWTETMGRLDTIIKYRQDRKGIIHCVSYDRQQQILEQSDYRGIMIAPRNSREFGEAMAEYLASPPPRLFVSPSATTGYDFPYEAAEYQIIVKLPRPDARSPIMKARSEVDPEYIPYITAQTLTQMCGRARRAADDQCENFILDRNAEWFLSPQKTGKYKGGFKHLFPEWFVRQVVYPQNGLPKPPVSFYDQPDFPF